MSCSLLNPVRFGQLTHEPASGTSVSSCLSNGADASCSKMFDSIHAVLTGPNSTRSSEVRLRRIFFSLLANRKFFSDSVATCQ
jgi:hypothetical protein